MQCLQKLGLLRFAVDWSCMAGRSTGSRARTTSSLKKAKDISPSRSTRGGSSRGTSGGSKGNSASRSADGVAQEERKRLGRKIDASTWKRADKVARTYRLVLETDEDGGYVASTSELPLVMGGGETIEACAADVIEATATVIATMIEKGETPPSPASAGKRDRQVNIRLTAEEKRQLEAASRREGFRSVSDFLRSAGLGQAG